MADKSNIDQEIKAIIDNLHPLERKIFPLLDRFSKLEDLVKESKLQEVEVLRALQWLQNKKLIILKQDVKELAVLGENGRKYKENNLPERRFLDALKDAKEHDINEVIDAAKISKEESNVSIGILKVKNVISVRKDNEKNVLLVQILDAGKKLLKEGFDEEKLLEREFPFEVKILNEEEKKCLQYLTKRKGLVEVDLYKIRAASLTDLGKKALKAGISDEEVVDRITQNMLKTGNWQEKRFRSYDIKAPVSRVFGGRRHFMNEAIDYVKRIWLDLGFKEMKGNIVQPSFWNFDALFTPQDHPAREMQDTFFIKNPNLADIPSNAASKELVKNIKETHEHGRDTGSTGWRYNWNIEEARKNVLRTHTTVLSAQTLARLKESDLPAKFFSVGTVFRNETLDWKHLFEFHQTDCIVVDPNANFKNLLGYLKDFFKKMGYEKVRFRPAYFPYTNCSTEVEVLHPINKKWMELGGAGIFRSEVVVPLLGKDIPVLAWGLGLERILMDYYEFNDLRDIYKNDLKLIRESKLFLR
ncbi:phenylalanine--tRNA ligase subunit alpha [Candidatus Woesearchaeota archaeon]|nr:phenylalanine--tRNA ligase subunit alpha [Candidatus Woesearchaeota archaeon]